MRATYTITVFAGALLLFLVQPMVGKMLLPRLGGAPAVWNTCMMFFQAALLAGYAYAHLLSKLRRISRQAIVHVVVLAAALAALPVALPAGSTPPAAASPLPWLLAVLLMTVGLPFFVVSSSAPLLQRWFAATDDPAAGDPYFLYAASNAGSLMALVAYPLLVEQALDLSRQALAWTVGYALFAALTGVCVLLALRRPGRLPDDTRDARGAEKPPPRRYMFWTLLAFVPSSLMLAVTQHLTTDVAAVPLLWVVPLGIYLLTFILAFAGRRFLHVRLWSRLYVVLAIAALAMAALWNTLPIAVILGMHLGLLFLGAMVCHGRLAASRPHPRFLTGFYLAIAAGGALGGVFNAIVAPQVFEAVLEYPLIIAAAFLLRDRAALGRPDVTLVRWLNRGLDAGFVVLTVSAIPFFMTLPDLEVIEMDRTFFGVHRVAADEQRYWIGYFNGTTLHNVQISEHPGIPLAYYHDDTGIGRLYAALGDDPRLDRVAVVGLGAGALLARARPGQHYTIYEIDPAVVRIARDPRFFTYLRDMPAEPEIVLGDGRLSLTEAPNGEYGLIILDAFSSDAIPVHLITVEAIDLYFRKLAPDGLLAVHATNRHLDIGRLVAGLARDRGLIALEWLGEQRASYDDGILEARWLVLGRDEAALAPLRADIRWEPMNGTGAPVWTDSFSNLTAIMEWWK